MLRVPLASSVVLKLSCRLILLKDGCRLTFSLVLGMWMPIDFESRSELTVFLPVEFEEI